MTFKSFARALLAGTALVAPLLSNSEVNAQSVWGGTGASTTTVDYNLGTNWSNPPAGAPPVNAGQAAQFNGTGQSSVTVTAGPITPNSWTFNAGSYSVLGQTVNFNGAGSNIINSGGTNSVSNNMTGAGISVAGGTLTVSGTSSFTTTSVSAGATFTNSGSLTTTLSNAGTSTNSGTTTGTLSNTAGTFSNTGTVTGAATVSGGAVTNTGTFQNTIGLSSGSFTNGFGGQVQGAITNNGGVVQNIRGTLASVTNLTGTFSNSGNVGAVTNNGAGTNNEFNGGGGTPRGVIASLANTGGTFSNGGTVSGASSVSGGTVTSYGDFQDTLNVSGGAFTNYVVPGPGGGGTGSVAGTTTITGGTVANNGGTFAAVINNASGTYNNNSGSAGALTNAATATNGGIIAGILTNSGTFTQSAGSASGGATNTGVINANGGAFNDVVNNNANGIFNIGGTVASDSGFNNSTATSRLLVNSGTYTVSGAITNSGTNAAGGVLIASGATLNANGGLTNNSGATFVNNGSATGGLNNAGTATISGTQNGGLTNSGAYTQTAGSTNGGAINTGNIQAGGDISSQVVFNDGVTNGANGVFTSAGYLAINGAFSNSTASSRLIVTGAYGLTTNGMVTNSGSDPAGGIFVVSNRSFFAAGGLTNNAGATFLNAGGTHGTELLNSGIAQNSGSLTFNTIVNSLGASFTNGNAVTGAFSNAGIVTNSSFAGFSGTFANSGSATNSGTIISLSNSGTYTQNGGVTDGGTTNTGIIQANAGAFNGAIANNAGTFNVGGTVTSNSTFDNASGAKLAVSSSGDYTVNGLVTNGGDLTIASGGSFTATAAGVRNSATGRIINNGTFRDDLDNVGAVTNNGAYFATVASNTGSITNNSTWTGNVTNTGGTVTNASGATWTGNATNNSGTFNNAGTIAGNFTNAGGTTNNSGAINGSLTNTGGTTNNTGSISGAITVTGGTYTGSGSVGTVSLDSNSRFVAGNGMAGSTSTVNGNLAFQSGAAYMVAVNPTTASSTTVTGTATIAGATVNATYANGSYINKRYTILTAGTLSGTFASLANTNLPTNFTSTLNYDAKNAYLDLALNFVAPPAPNGPSFGNGLSSNQQAVANTLVNYFNTTGGIPMAFGSLNAAGLTQASGETAVGSQQTTFNAMNQFMNIIGDPTVEGRGASVTSEPLAYAEKRSPSDALAAIYHKAPLAAPAFMPSWSVWVAGFGGSQTTDGGSGLGSNTATSRIYGTAVGADYWFSPNTVAGFALAGGGTTFSVANGGTGRSDLFQAGAFVRHSMGAAYINAALAYGWQDVTNERAIGGDRLLGQFNANAISGRLEGGYRYVSPWMGYTPYAAVQVTNFGLPGYSETTLSGVNTFGLAYASKDVTTTRTELGLRTDKSFLVNDAVLTLRGRAAWAHDFNTDRSVAATFQSLPGASFVVNGAAAAANAALTTASAEMKWKNGWSAAATFEGEFSDVTRSYAGKGVVRYAW